MPQHVVVSKDAFTHHHFRNILLACGGMCAIRYSNTIPFAQFLTLLPAECQALDLTPQTQFIVVLAEARALLTDDEFTAGLLHEEGHIVLGHLEGDVNDGLVTNEDFEFEADAYAVERTSREAMTDVLTKMKTILLDVSFPILFGKTYTDNTALQENVSTKIDEGLAARLARLQG